MNPPRFRLRTLMAGVVASAFLLAWVRAAGSMVDALFPFFPTILSWSLAFILTFAAARAELPRVRNRSGRLAISSLLVVFLVASAYILWAYQRVAWGDWGELYHDFPYPDHAINARARWHDARHPVTPGNIKIHGELARVMADLWISTLTLAALDGLLLGLLAPPRKAPS